MSRSGSESGGLVLKKWSGFKTDKQKKKREKVWNEMK
jgi:hypothetical protein